MGLERRGPGGNYYYYRKRREGKRVRSEYVGGGAWAEAAAALYAAARQERAEARAVVKADLAEAAALDREVYRVLSLARDLAAAALEDAGYHRHKGQWRRRR
jgi:hypothetical protein